MTYEIKNISQTIAFNIKRICKEQDVSMHIMLKDLDIGRNFLFSLKNIKEPSVVKLIKICDYLDVEFDDLLVRRW